MIKELYNKWIKESIWYIFDSKYRESRNVSKFLKSQLDNSTLKQIVKDNNWETKSNDRKIIAILKWVHDNIKYVSDRIQYKRTEYWANPVETIINGKGDCEDGAILIYCLARIAGIPIEQIKLVAGNVKSGNKTSGHAWIRYQSDYALNACHMIDWCYWYTPKYIQYRTAYFDFIDNKIIGDDKYISYWFLADENNGYKKFKW